MVIISGEVRITQRAKVSGEETLTVLKKGDFFGEMALLEDLPRSATAIAHSDTFMLEISRDKFLHFIEKDTASGVKILFTLAKILSARLREADSQDQGLRQPQPVDLKPTAAAGMIRFSKLLGLLTLFASWFWGTAAGFFLLAGCIWIVVSEYCIGNFLKDHCGRAPICGCCFRRSCCGITPRSVIFASAWPAFSC